MTIPATASVPLTNSVTPSASTSAAASTVASTSNGLLDPNEFLSLLVDNLKYQDPLDPTSSADFLTQLASLSQVQTEEQVATTDQTSAAANLIGDTVSGSDASGLPVTGIVSGFSMTANGPTLDVANDSISLGEITSVLQSASQSASTPSTTPTAGSGSAS
jgi:flagellar basal-body rod modification protein FlgD